MFIKEITRLFIVLLLYHLDVLRQSADDFDFTARRLKRKMCWKNVKLWFILLFVLVVILIVLISKRERERERESNS